MSVPKSYALAVRDAAETSSSWKPSHDFGKFEISYSYIFSHMFKLPVKSQTLAFAFYKQLFFDSPGSFIITGGMHQNTKEDEVHISFDVVVSPKGWKHSLHLYGMPKGSAGFFMTRLSAQTYVSPFKKQRYLLREDVAIFDDGKYDDEEEAPAFVDDA
jgi:hypothetical protein